MLNTLIRSLRKLAWSVGIFTAVLPPMQAAILYVAPDGNDAWLGKLARPNAARTDGPLASLPGARDALRKGKATAARVEPVRILIADGQYPVTESLTFGPEDGGTETAPVSYEATTGARPVFSGGRVIRGWQLGPNGIWQTRLSDVAAGRWYFEQLFVNGHRATRARTPNQFYFHILDLQEEALGQGGGRRAKQARQTLWMRPDDFKAIAGLKPEELKDVNLVVYHNWDNTRRFIDRVDEAENSLVTSGEGMKSWNPWRKNSHFIFENFLRALDAPGEWFLSRDGTLYYKPLPGEDMTTAEVIAPVAEKFIIIKGDPAADQFVEHVTFRGLAFRHAQWLTPPGGFEPAQAAAPIDAVVLADGARHVTVEDCEIGHIGTYGLWFRRGCRDDVIRHCYVHDFGAGAIRIGETGIAQNLAERTSHVVVDNNIILHGGYIFPCAVGVWVGHSPDNQITHNEIGDLFYTGVSVGWRWGYAESLAKRNTIAFNHVHHIGWGLLSDMGGIYTLGPSEGTVVTNNVFHDVYAYSYGGWGLYTDEGSTGILFENNLVYNVKNGGFHQHYGKENILRNNILAFSKLYQLQATRVEPHLSFTFENNLVYWNEGVLLQGPWDKVNHVMRSNCYWNASAGPVSFVGRTLAAWQARTNDLGSIIADPKFADTDKLDFRLPPDNEALAKIGFKPFDASQAGVYGDTAWIAKAKSVTYRPLEIAPEPPPVPLRDTFERDAVGRPPKGPEVHVEGLGDSIVVTEETAASGKRSLKITDAPGLKNLWDPHLNYRVNYSEGALSNTFDLRVEPGAIIDFEWRDWSEAQYYTGPHFSVRDGKLRMGGDSVDLPLSQWIHLEITSTLGKAGTGQWSLAVTLPGQAPREFKNLPLASPRFKKLTWLGFTSNASTATSFYLDNIALNVK